MQNNKLGNNAIATGTADAIILDYNPIKATLSDKLVILFRASGSNTITNPTVNTNGIGAKTIYKHGGQALNVGDIPGADAICILQYDLSNDWWELLNPVYSGINGSGLFIFMTGGNQSTTSATATAITDLITPTLEANSRYIINAHIHIGCNNTGGVLFAIDIPSGSVYLSYQGRTSSGTAYRAITNNSDATLFSSAFSTFNNSLGFVTVCGEIATGVSGGTAQLMFASGTAGQTSLIYQEGTWVFIKKIA
jgi:hypothetical protein